jgi:hypothetical protein
MDYEQTAGRAPKEMPHKNPGYDIESRDADGNIVRYIEVKSLSGAWHSNYAVLSNRQFAYGLEHTERFWLYVVEHAERDDFRIFRIPNPPCRANKFMFDDGWQALAEVDPPVTEGE